jgi:hypothetical protein
MTSAQFRPVLEPSREHTLHPARRIIILLLLLLPTSRTAASSYGLADVCQVGLGGRHEGPSVVVVVWARGRGRGTGMRELRKIVGERDGRCARGVGLELGDQVGATGKDRREGRRG